MASALQTDGAVHLWLIDYGVPLLERQHYDVLLQKRQVARHLGRVATDFQLVGVFEYQRQ